MEIELMSAIAIDSFGKTIDELPEVNSIDDLQNWISNSGKNFYQINYTLFDQNTGQEFANKSYRPDRDGNDFFATVQGHAVV